jgi:hypothetical protein
MSERWCGAGTTVSTLLPRASKPTLSSRNRSASLRLADHLDILPELGPSSVRGNDPARFKNDCGGDDKRISETETSPMSGAQLGGSPGDLAGGGLNRRRKGLEEVVDGIAARCALP